ncbi:hypothetical protein O3M35_006357 [Rhynocoris fuscipes]|uniref:Uncharacterized protein n=1 Tax=Rhynocoris fuscipes TaxID=488301 RepID=A0AAW1DDY2_9HEMI
MTPLHTFLVALLSIGLQQADCGEERRSDVRAVLGASEAEPGFWPTRGRRGDSTSSEEVQPPFWAHRGREENQSPPCDSSYNLANRLYAQEPKFLLLHRRETQEQDPFWVSRGRKRAQK